MPKFEIEIDGLPGGYIPIAWREPREGEIYAYPHHGKMQVEVATYDYMYARYLIVEKTANPQ